MAKSSITLSFPHSLDAYWEFLTAPELKAALQDRYVLPDDFDWDQPPEQLLDGVVNATGMSVFQLAEDWCGNQDDVSGPLLKGLEVVGNTVGDESQIQRTINHELPCASKDGEITVYWIDSNAFSYRSVFEVDDVFDYTKLELILQPTYDNAAVIVDVYYDGNWIELEQEEVGSAQPYSGFDFRRSSHRWLRQRRSPFRRCFEAPQRPVGRLSRSQRCGRAGSTRLRNPNRRVRGRAEPIQV